MTEINDYSTTDLDPALTRAEIILAIHGHFRMQPTVNQP